MDAPAQARRASRRLVLVVDSDADALEQTSTLLAHEDRDIITAGSAQEVRQALTGVRPDAIVLEPALEGTDGFLLCRSIVEGYGSAAPTVILASGKIRGKRAHSQAREAGAFLFVERPEQDRTLVDAVGHAIARAENPDQAERDTSRAPAMEPERPAVGGVPVGEAEIGAPGIDLSEASPDEFNHWLDDAFSTFSERLEPQVSEIPVAASCSVATGPASDAGDGQETVVLADSAPEAGNANESPHRTPTDTKVEPYERLAPDAAQGTRVDDVTDVLGAVDDDVTEATGDAAEVRRIDSTDDLQRPADEADDADVVPMPESAGEDVIGSALEDAFSNLGQPAPEDRVGFEVPNTAALPGGDGPAPAAGPASMRLPAQDDAPRAADSIARPAAVDVGSSVFDEIAAEEPAWTGPALVPPPEPAATTGARPPVAPIPAKRPPLDHKTQARSGTPGMIGAGLGAAALVVLGVMLVQLLPWNRAPGTDASIAAKPAYERGRTTIPTASMPNGSAGERDVTTDESGAPRGDGERSADPGPTTGALDNAIPEPAPRRSAKGVPTPARAASTRLSAAPVRRPAPNVTRAAESAERRASAAGGTRSDEDAAAVESRDETSLAEPSADSTAGDAVAAGETVLEESATWIAKNLAGSAGPTIVPETLAATEDVTASDNEVDAPGNAVLAAPDLAPVANLISAPEVIRGSRAQPRYPVAARRARVSGVVLLHVRVGDDGSVREVRVLEEPTPALGFGRAAENAVSSWRFRPATSNGDPVETWTTVRVKFDP